MYQIGENVLYGADGVCKIEEICEMKFTDTADQYYVLRPIFHEGSTVFVPVNNEKLTAKMRPILTKEEIEAIFEKLRAEEPVWMEDAAERKAEFQKIMLGGDRCEILRMIRTLLLRKSYLQEIGKHFRVSDDQTLRDAQRLLSDEFSLVLEIRPREVPEYIRKQLEE